MGRAARGPGGPQRRRALRRPWRCDAAGARRGRHRRALDRRPGLRWPLPAHPPRRAGAPARTPAGARAIVYDVQFTEPADAAGRPGALRRPRRAPAARPRDDRERRRRRAPTSSAATTTCAASHCARGGRELPTLDGGGVIRRYGTRRPARHARRRRRASAPGRRADLRRPAAPRSSTSPDRPGPSRTVSFADVLAGPRPGPPSAAASSWSARRAPALQDLHATSADGTEHVRARDPGQRHLHRPARLPAARPAALARRLSVAAARRAAGPAAPARCASARRRARAGRRAAHALVARSWRSTPAWSSPVVAPAGRAARRRRARSPPATWPRAASAAASAATATSWRPRSRARTAELRHASSRSSAAWRAPPSCATPTPAGTSSA